MATDRLRVEGNERLDLHDFQYLLGEHEINPHRQLLSQLICSPNRERKWILSGFAISNPSGTQVQVAKGRGLFAEYRAGEVYYGMLATEGDATKIVDINTYASGLYGIFVRFEEVEGNFQPRIFWNASGLGSEYTETVATRYQANWSVRVETASPGDEWLQIGTVNRADMALVDMRDFYFEGPVDGSYASGWSSDGGGVANDRNADRSTYGIADFQAAFAATRQCLEDIKGRGLRRWWERDIGGMNIGFDAAPVEDRLALGDANFYLDGASQSLVFEAGDSFSFSRGDSRYSWLIATTEEMRLGASGLAIGNGLYVGDVTGSPVDNAVIAEGDGTFGGGLRVGFTGTPTADRIELGDSTMFLQYSASPYLQFDTGDQFGYDRAANRFWFAVGTAEEMRVQGTGIAVADGIFVGNIAGTPVSGQLNIGDANFYAKIDTSDPHIFFDPLDYLYYSRSGNSLNFFVGGNKIAGWSAALCEVGSSFEITGGTSKLILPNSSGGSVAVGTFWRTTYGGNLASGNGTYAMPYPGMLKIDGNVVLGVPGAFSTITIVGGTLGANSHIRGRATFMFSAGATGTVGFKLGATTIAYVAETVGSAPCFLEFDIRVPSAPGTQTLTGIGYGIAGDGSDDWSNIDLSVDTSSSFNITCELLGASGGTVNMRSFTVEVTSGV